MKRLKHILHTIYSGPWYKRLLVWTLTIIIAIALLFVAIDVNLLWLFGRSPSLHQIENPVTSEASEIYSADSVLLGRFFNENRTPVTFEEINPLVIRTLIATEDERFYKHHGVDFAGLFAAIKDIIKGQPRGASTITQQLAKNLFRVRTQYSTGLTGKIPGVKILVMKAKEWIVATKLEMTFSKEEILTMYLNTVDFGSNSFGIKTAARTYFGTTPDSLDYLEAATLVGLLKATSSYNPRLHPKASQHRRNIVLQNLYNQGGIILNGQKATPQQFDSLLAQPTRCVDHVEESSYDGLAPYFRTQLQDYINDLCDQGLIGGPTNERLDLYADGLRIYTSLNSHLQRYAEDAAREQMRVLQQRFDDHWRGQNPWQDRYHHEIPHFIEDLAKRTTYYKYLSKRFPEQPDSVDYYLNQPHRVKLFSYDGPIYRDISTMDSIRYMVSILHCGFVAIEPDTRYVRAWVGDIDFDSWKYDKVTAMRQPGSTFKLFVYAEAMNKGLNPCDRRMDAWSSYTDTIDGKPKQWAPHNANGTFSGANMTLKLAFAQSINSIAVKLGYEVGIRDIIRTAHQMGIQSELEPVPSLSLGASDVNLLELVNSYCTVIDEGNYQAPVMVLRIEDRDGHTIFEARPEKKHALSRRSAFFMQQLLRGGLTQPGGTTAALWQYIHPVLDKAEFGGKTGTSNNHSDAWFVGVTPKLVAGGWVGGEYRSIHFRTGQLGQGSRTALPIFGKFIQRTLLDPRFSCYYAHFPGAPEGVLKSEYECAATIFPEDTMQMDSFALEGIPLDDAGQLDEPIEDILMEEPTDSL
ncbi:MAG: penicillin-binding protein [Bacteroidaceae bacterium]|nr:penicillin-binding protein [Bacteroidaceae bacterium]